MSNITSFWPAANVQLANPQGLKTTETQLARQLQCLINEKNNNFKTTSTYLLHNCVSNKILEYDWLLTAPYLWLNWLFQSKLSDLTCPITNICNRTGQIGQLSSPYKLCTSCHQEPITRSLHLCCTLESTLSNEELFLEQAFPRKSIVSEDANVNEND